MSGIQTPRHSRIQNRVTENQEEKKSQIIETDPQATRHRGNQNETRTGFSFFLRKEISGDCITPKLEL